MNTKFLQMFRGLIITSLIMLSVFVSCCGYGQPIRGVNAYVYALATDKNGNVYAGGYFDQAGTLENVGAIAVWNPDTQTWSRLLYGNPNNPYPNGVAGTVYAIGIGSDGKVYVGGNFVGYQTGDEDNFDIWDPVTTNWIGEEWQVGRSPASGDSVRGIAVSSNMVYVVGNFNSVGNGSNGVFVAVTNIAVFNTVSETWSSVTPPPASIGTPDAIATSDGVTFYVGGSAGGGIGGAAVGHLTNGKITWQQLDPGVECSVSAIAIAPSGQVFLNGEFFMGTWYSVVQLVGTNFVKLPNVEYYGVPGLALSFLNNTNLIVGGSFIIPNSSGQYNAYQIAGYNIVTSNWFTLGGPPSVNGPVDALATYSNMVYAGGTFTTVGTNECVKYVAGWNSLNNVWSVVGPNAPPIVSLTSPNTKTTTTIAAPANIQISADASDDCNLAKVIFENGNAVLYKVEPNSQTWTGSYIWPAVPAGTYSFTAVATDNDGATTTSSAATVNVLDPPVITVQPQTQTVNAGNSVTFSVTAQGSDPLSYQWQSNNVNIAAANSSSYTINSVSPNDAAGYRVIVSNPVGSATSQTATLNVSTPPIITVQPLSQRVYAGDSVTFSVTAQGTAPLSYQWQFNGANIQGATSASYSINPVAYGDAGNYSVTVNNSAGSVSSATAVLTVLSAQEGLLDVNFGAAATSKVGFAAAGQTTNDYWNGYQYPNQTSVTVTNLEWTDRNNSGISLNVQNAPGVWGNTTGDGMYDRFIYPFNGGDITVTVSNVPAGCYDFYLYGHAENAPGNSKFQISTGTSTTVWEETADSTYAATSSNWVEGQQYVVFRHVDVVTNGQPIIITCAPGDYENIAYFNGFQMIRSPLLDVNFGAAATSKVGFAAAGQTTNDYWNGYQYPNQTSVTVTNLEWTDRNNSGISLNVQNAPGVWGNTTGDGMYDRFIYPFNYGDITATVSNVPAGSYDFYLYGHAENAPGNSQFQISTGTATTAWEGTADSTYAATSANWVEGQQYVVFRHVDVVTNGQPVVITCAGGDYYNIAYFNGFQMVPSQ